MNNMHEYRSAIFIPGSNEKMLAKANSLDADLILFDLEDSVPPTKKEHARELVVASLEETRNSEETRKSQTAYGVRVNDLSSGHTLADLTAILPAKPDVIMLPKVESGDDLVKVDTMFSELEDKTKTSFANIKLLLLTAETPASIFQFNSLKNISNRLTGLTWGAEDFANELGALSNRDESGTWLPPFQLAQTLCLIKARDLDVQAIDTVYTDIKNTDGLRAECIAAKQIGFTGKLAIHPGQLAVINEVFSPSEQEVNHAQRLVELFANNPNAGALELDGKMIDKPHLRAAERLLKRRST